MVRNGETRQPRGPKWGLPMHRKPRSKAQIEKTRRETLEALISYAYTANCSLMYAIHTCIAPTRPNWKEYAARELEALGCDLLVCRNG